MKLIHFTVLFTLIAFSVIAQDKVAVLPTYDIEKKVNDSYEQMIRERLATAITNSQEYAVIDFTGIDAIIDLKSYQDDGIITEKAKIELGNIPGCKYVLRTEVSTDTKHVIITVKMLYTETLQMVPNRSSTEYAEINAPSIYNTCDKIIKDFHTNSPWPAGIWSYSLDGKFYLFEDGTGEYYNKTNSHLNRNITWKVEGNILKIEKKFNTWFEILESDNSFMEKSDTAICRIIQVCKKEFSSSDNSYKYEFSYDMTEQKILHGKYFYHTWLYSHDKATVNITEWKGRKFFEKQIVLEYLGPVVCSKYK